MAESPNLLAKIWYGLTVHILFFVFLNLQAKFFKFTFCLWQNFQRIIQIPRNSPQKSHE